MITLLYFIAPTFFFRTWMNALFGTSSNFHNKLPLDLSSKELIIYIGLITTMF
jgi:hypothetical protein